MTCEEFRQTVALHPATVTRAVVAAVVVHRRTCDECHAYLERITGGVSRVDEATLRQCEAVESDSECSEMFTATPVRKRN